LTESRVVRDDRGRGGAGPPADEVERGGEGLIALFPLGGADLARVGGDVLGGLHLAEELHGVAANALGGHLEELDDALGVDEEGAAVGQALTLAEDLEVAGDLERRVAEHRILDLADGVGAAVPGLVGEVRVGGDRVDLDPEALELLVVVGQVAQLGGADEGEVGRVEEHDRPRPLQVGVGDVDELAVVEGGGGEGLDLGVDERHVRSDLSDLGCGW
jgi:hypothetical protein